MNNPRDSEREKPKTKKHWLLWTLVVIFIVGSIAEMMVADYLYAPGSSGNSSEPKDAADK